MIGVSTGSLGKFPSDNLTPISSPHLFKLKTADLFLSDWRFGARSLLEQPRILASDAMSSLTRRRVYVPEIPGSALRASLENNRK